MSCLERCPYRERFHTLRIMVWHHQLAKTISQNNLSVFDTAAVYRQQWGSEVSHIESPDTETEDAECGQYDGQDGPSHTHSCHQNDW